MPSFARRKSRVILISRSSIAFVALLLAGGCGKAPGAPLDDDEKIVRAVLGVLVSDHKPLCVDGSTSGRALTTFREYALAPSPSRRMLAWAPPQAFRPPPMPTAAEMDAAERQGREIHLPEPAQRQDPLPVAQQSALNAAARALSMPPVPDSSVTIDAAWAPRGVTMRWWPVNRVTGTCTPPYMLSNPARNRGLAFVQVRAGHWGTIYALQPKGSDWAPIAQWNAWLY